MKLAPTEDKGAGGTSITLNLDLGLTNTIVILTQNKSTATCVPRIKTVAKAALKQLQGELIGAGSLL